MGASIFCIHSTTPLCECKPNDLGLFNDYQNSKTALVKSKKLIETKKGVNTLWEKERAKIDKELDTIADRLEGFSKLAEYHKSLTRTVYEEGENGAALQIEAAKRLGEVARNNEALELAVTNCLINGFEVRRSEGINGQVGIAITNELGHLHKRRASPLIVQFFRDQAKGLESDACKCEGVYRPAVQSVFRALDELDKIDSA